MPDDPEVFDLLQEMVESGKTPEEVCRDRPQLLAEVRRRWKQFRLVDAQIGAFLPDSPPSPNGDEVAPERRLPRMPLIPGYDVEAELGSGGMGVVYKARHRALGRTVAIKMLLAGPFAGPHERARFRREAEALAGLRHANIVQVYDAGEVDGRPYFTMEFVEGGSLAHQLSARPQPPKRSAELIATLARAVAFAHRSGIVHRDLKPSNILATADGTLKISDFGLALPVSDGTRFTISGTRVGTPSYMAPEQALGKTSAVGPAVDIYALGAVLYELLTGRPPFVGETAAETERRVIAEEPIPPSRLIRTIPRDLETICLKCLRKEPESRYAAAAELASDLDRFLEGRPILARRLGMAARFGRWCRRNPAATAISVLLVLGTAISTWQAVSATRAKGEALEARQAEAERAEGERKAKLEAQAQKATAERAADAEKAAKAQAQKRLAQVEKANDLLASIFYHLDPKEIARAERPLQAILVEKLDMAVQQLSGESIGDSLVVANMQDKFGLSLVGLGEPGKAIVLFQRALAARQALLGPEDRLTLASRHDLALAYQAAGKLDLALLLQEETVKLMKARLGPEDSDTINGMNNLGLMRLAKGDSESALSLEEETVRLMKAKLGPDHPDTLVGMNNLGMAYQAVGKLDLAVSLFEETLKLKKARLGPYHPHTLDTMDNLATAYEAAGKVELAIPLLEATLKCRKSSLDANHPETLNSMSNLALAYQRAGKMDLALALFNEALGREKARLGNEHPDTIRDMHRYGFLRNLVTAEERYKANLAKLGPDHIDTVLARRDLAQMYLASNRLDDAEVTLAEVIKKLNPRPGDDPIVKFTISLLRNCVTARERAMPNSWLTFRSKSRLGGALLEIKNYSAAEPLLLEAYHGIKAREATIPPGERVHLSDAATRLVQLYEAINDKALAVKWRKESSRAASELPTTP
jgi:tetratricopeptide (TPR) repeat protein/predicted Ser/Thr protein kinase